MQFHAGRKNGQQLGAQASRLKRMLKGVRCLGTLSKQALHDLATCADEIDVPRGTVLFESGEQASGLYVVLSGCVKLILPTASPQQELVVSLIRPGESFDSAAMFDEAPHRLSARTACRSHLLYVPKEDVQRLLERFPTLSYVLAKEVSRTVYELVRQLRETRSANLGKQRLARFLLKGLPQGRRQGSAVITLPESKRAIAGSLQITPEHFSRVLKELRSSGYISVDGMRVAIHDISGLREFARSTSAHRSVHKARRLTTALPRSSARQGRPSRDTVQ
jgi:CRP-like cAMP-binding protein